MNYKAQIKYSSYVLVIALLTSCGQPQARKPVVQKTSTFLKESIERNKVINQGEESVFKSLIASDSINSYITSPNGFWYYYNKRDSISTKYPVRGDEVIYEYEITDVNGDLMYSKEELGVRNYLVDKEELISGLQAGLKLMKAGEEVTFLFPSHKAYGYSGYKKIGSNQPLIYKVELKQIKTSN
tara:strand:- start:122826 stop:123377 length:552 start_codon:yes stop_codon:yes gene_type:complete